MRGIDEYSWRKNWGRWATTISFLRRGDFRGNIEGFVGQNKPPRRLVVPNTRDDMDASHRSVGNVCRSGFFCSPAYLITEFPRKRESHVGQAPHYCCYRFVRCRHLHLHQRLSLHVPSTGIYRGCGSLVKRCTKL